MTYNVTPSLRITAGVRYTRDRKSTDNFLLNSLVICPGSLTTPPAPFCFGASRLPVQLGVPARFIDASGNLIPVVTGNGGSPQDSFIANSIVVNSVVKKFSRLTWRAGIDYDLAAHSLLYATFETGYKSGGLFSTPDPLNFSYDPETIEAYTIGSKNRFLGNRLQVNAELFWWNYKNQQVSHFTSYLGSPVFATDNIGSSRIRGAEIEMRARVASHTEVNLNAQYLDTVTKSFTYNSSALAGPPTTGCAVTGGPPASENYVVDCSGRRMVNAPTWTMTAGLEQRISLGEKGQLTFNGETHYQSSLYTGREYLTAELQKGYFLTDLQLRYDNGDEKFYVAGFVRNVGDVHAVVFSELQQRATGLIIQNLNMPRTYGVRAGVKF